MSRKKTLRLISLVMLAVAIVFVMCALSNPALGSTIYIGSLEFGAEYWRICYAAYVAIMIALFAASFFVGEKGSSEEAMERKLGRGIVIAATVVILVGIFAKGLFGGSPFEARITIPAGSQDEYVFYDQEISSYRDTVTVSAGEGLGDTTVMLESHDGSDRVSTYLTPGMPVELEVEPGAWYKVGVSQQNPTDADQEAVVLIDGLLELRIE